MWGFVHSKCNTFVILSFFKKGGRSTQGLYLWLCTWGSPSISIMNANFSVSASTHCQLHSVSRSWTDYHSQWARSSSWSAQWECCYGLERYLDEIQDLACTAGIHRGRVLVLTWEHLLSKAIWKINNYIITWHSVVPNVEKTTLVDQEGRLWRKRKPGLIKPKVLLIRYPASWKLPVLSAPEEDVKSLSL